MAKPTACIISGAFDSSVMRTMIQGGFSIVDHPKKADITVFTGGEDIDPGLYGQQALPGTYHNNKRDLAEKRIFELVGQKPKVGICRGGQLMNALSGGSMYQDVTNHGRSHDIKMLDGTIIRVSSMHHQQMIAGKDGLVLANATVATRKASHDPKRDVVVFEEPDASVAGVLWEDVEIVWYPTTKSLCYQPHPECGTNGEKALFFHLIKEYFDLEGKTTFTERYAAAAASKC